MRVAIIYRPKNTPPPDLFPQLLQGLADWVARHRDRMETLELFLGGGGFAVLDVGDAAGLHRLVAENPFTPFSDVEIRPVVDPDTGLRTFQEVFPAR
jgi:hypothetical protein